MTETRRVRVGDVMKLERRPVDVSSQTEYREIGIRSFGRGIFHKDPVDGLELGSKRVFWIKPNDLVLSNVFAWEGAIALASIEEEGMIGSHRFMTYVPADEALDITWVSWFFRSEHGLELIRAASPGSAGRNRTLAIEKFENIEMPLPPLTIQLSAAKTIGLIATGVTKVAVAREEADNLRQALAVSLCTRADRATDELEADGWRRVTLGDVMRENTTKRLVEPGETYRIAGVFSFGKGLIDRGYLSSEDTKYKTLNVLGRDDVVLSKLGAWEGAVGVVGPEFDCAHVSSEFPTFEIDKSQLLPSFFAGVTRSPAFWSAIDDATKGSMARRKRITPQRFLALGLLLPTMEYQQSTVLRLATINEVSAVHGNELSRVEALVPATLNALLG